MKVMYQHVLRKPTKEVTQGDKDNITMSLVAI
jgi:hypothetical protein